MLADDRVKRRKVGLVGEADRQAEGQELLSQLHYLRRALTPTTDLVEGGLGDVLDTAPDVIVLADQVDLAEADDLSAWVDDGGLLIRFAGPRMAAFEELQTEPLVPVALRQGGRDIGGALSWGDPRGIAPFAADGVFAGLTAPEDVAIRAQLMAQPAPDLADKTLAALSDNTPLVTRDRVGQGQVVLFHVTRPPALPRPRKERTTATNPSGRRKRCWTALAAPRPRTVWPRWRQRIWRSVPVPTARRAFMRQATGGLR